MNILVIGGSGFLGSHVADQLSIVGYNVSIFDTTPSKWLRSDKKMIIPHVGWNFIKSNNDNFDSDIFNSIQYFVHSFNATNVPLDNIMHTFNYYQKEWIASIIKDNIVGFQFHPERSGLQGLKILDYFAKLLLKV